MEPPSGLAGRPVFVGSRPEPAPRPELKLLLQLEPWGRSFGRNLLDALLFRRPPRVRVTSQPGAFWPDVFVSRHLPWMAFAESGLCHIVVLASLLMLGRILELRPQLQPPPKFDRSQVIYYSPSEYLPPLDTGQSHATKTQTGEPEYARQPILSLPPEADNREQTIVTPPDIKLNQTVQTPNIVAWGNHSASVPIQATERTSTPMTSPTGIVAPPPEVARNANRSTASLSQAVVEPPPEVARQARQLQPLAQAVVVPAPATSAAPTRRVLETPRAAVVEPPPSVDAVANRHPGEINIVNMEVVAPAPHLPVSTQRAVPALDGSGRAVVPPPPATDSVSRGSPGGNQGASTQVGLRESEQSIVPPPPAADEVSHGASGRAQPASLGALGGVAGPVVPLPPSMQGAANGGTDGRMIALGIHPAAAPPPEPPPGNRRGTFAANPEGKAGAPGTPDVRSEKSAGTDGHGAGSGAGTGSGSHSSDAPPGLHVGVAPGSPSATTGGSPAGITASHGADPNVMASARTGGPSLPKAIVDASPDPASAELAQQVFGGRRFYAMTLNMPNLNSGGGSWVIRFAELKNDGSEGDLTSPVPEHKVDPAYPIELMRQNVGGTVALSAVIRSDGSVGNVRVVRSVDDRLDRYAAEALSRWHFYPATKNGSPIDLEAVVMIPFKPIRHKPNF